MQAPCNDEGLDEPVSKAESAVRLHDQLAHGWQCALRDLKGSKAKHFLTFDMALQIIGSRATFHLALAFYARKIPGSFVNMFAKNIALCLDH